MFRVICGGFIHPNIHPKKEYELRKEENIRFAEKHNIPFVDADYDVTTGLSGQRGIELDPEKGIRCTICFDIRFERIALYAYENGFDVKYCGCAYPLRDTNKWRMENGRDKIKPTEKFYGTSSENTNV
ncbi:MAG: epoxyqueuosine reductase QueH [Agriterribacter sp.]